MKNYECEVWFRRANGDKDFEILNIDANSVEEAIIIAKDLVSYAFKINVKLIY